MLMVPLLTGIDRMFPTFAMARTYKLSGYRSSIIPLSLQPTIRPSPYSVYPIHAALLCIPCLGMNLTSSASEINYAYVLIHGFASVPALSGSWDDVKDVLHEEAGVQESDILMLQMPLFRHIEERTKSAIHKINEKLPGRIVHLIAHSMVRSLPFLIVRVVN